MPSKTRTGRQPAAPTPSAAEPARKARTRNAAAAATDTSLTAATTASAAAGPTPAAASGRKGRAQASAAAQPVSTPAAADSPARKTRPAAKPVVQPAAPLAPTAARDNAAAAVAEAEPRQATARKTAKTAGAAEAQKASAAPSAAKTGKAARTGKTDKTAETAETAETAKATKTSKAAKSAKAARPALVALQQADVPVVAPVPAPAPATPPPGRRKATGKAAAAEAAASPVDDGAGRDPGDAAAPQAVRQDDAPVARRKPRRPAADAVAGVDLDVARDVARDVAADVVGEAAGDSQPPPAPDMARAAAPVPATAQPSHVTRPADGAVFGTYAVDLPDDEPAQVTLRAALPGSAVCTCLEYELDEHATCPHVQAVLADVQADANRAAALAAGPGHVASRLLLQHGALHRLLWLPGRECPPALDHLATRLFTAEAPDDQAVPRVLRAAREAGHAVLVDEAVWAHLAVTRDTRWRVQRLEGLLPQGPHSPDLHGPGGRPLLPLQAEAALFAVCAGRCILADDAVLAPEEQAVAALALWRQHFGVQRVLVLAPAAELGAWRDRLPADALARGDISLMALDSVATDAALHADLAPQLVLLHEPAEGGLWVDADRAAALLRLRTPLALVVASPAVLDRPAEWPLRLAFVDAARTGAFAALLHQHGDRDEQGQLQGLVQLEDLRQTLETVLLLRLRAEVLAQLPDRVDQVLQLAMADGDQARHAECLAPVLAAVERWQQLGWLADAEQRQLVEQVQVLRQLCAGVGAPGVAAAKAAAVLAALGDKGQAVVFSQWPHALDLLATALAAAGVAVARLSGQEDTATRAAALAHFQAGTGRRVLLVADTGSALLDLPSTPASPVPPAAVVHLDRPWNPRLLSRRFARVHRRGKAHLVPVTHLVAAGSFEAGMLRVLADRREPVADWLDANAADGFLQGDELAQFMADLADVLGVAPAPAAAVGAASVVLEPSA